MRQRIFFILSLVIGLALAGTALAAPPRTMRRAGPPATPPGLAQKQMVKERFTGRVEEVQGQRAIVRTPQGRRMEVNLGPEKFWREKGYNLNPGSEITVQGWHPEGDEGGPVFAAGIWGPDFYFELTNDAGFPYWADQDDYWDGWYPTYDYYDNYYCGPNPYVYGPPPAWWYGPPPPRWWYRHHHFYGRPGFRWGWQDRWHHDGRGYGRGHYRGRGGDDRGGWRGGDDRGNDGGGDWNQRGGRRGR